MYRDRRTEEPARLELALQQRGGFSGRGRALEHVQHQEPQLQRKRIGRSRRLRVCTHGIAVPMTHYRVRRKPRRVLKSTLRECVHCGLMGRPWVALR